MNEPFKLIGKDSLRLSSEQAFFTNLSLNTDNLSKALLPFTDVICQRIEATYKSPAKISLSSINAMFKSQLSDFMQFDDIGIKFWHSDSKSDIFAIMNTRLARSLLIRLLATSLIDDSHGLLFSSTEKGIFSFMVARLLFDLKNSFPEKMPDLKLIGIYHRQDEAINDAAIGGFGLLNFSLSFAADVYTISFVIPRIIFNKTKPYFNQKYLLDRSGHLVRPLIFRLRILNIAQLALDSLDFGDLILFDKARQSWSEQGLAGPLHGIWNDLAISGQLHSEKGCYQFVLNNSDTFKQLEGVHMEEIQFNGHNQMPTNLNKSPVELAKNIRVPLSIEISRLPMTLKELCHLKEGQIIDLNRKIDDPLELVVEGKVIGYCQPIQIDSRLGIRILSMNNNDN